MKNSLKLIKQIFRGRISPFCYIRKCEISNIVRIKRFCKLINVKVGDYSYIANNSHLINCSIGKFCSIGPFVKIGLGKHPVDRFSTSPIFYSTKNPLRINLVSQNTFKEFEEVSIGNDVWIGANAIIMDGVKIGDGAIVAAGAVVTKNVPDYAIVGGVPAKIIKYRFEESIIQKLKTVKWWEMDLNRLNKYEREFENIELFLNKIMEKEDIN
ncbi:CatB-related O-acetyltransferase [Caldibacillus debilis]|uniref:CatB-related O-acetyltransferase n=1 Tax=Caldibacillus debilis TaxID=301148 RepID=UPI00037471BA|nr:CatB-related O-acetyltransferase [Caldibacillus debilis]